MFYSDPTTLGNEDLNPEEALSEEVGVQYRKKNVTATLAFFNRDSNNIIDYVKENEEDLWQATNIRDLNTKGLEAHLNLVLPLLGTDQNLDLGYTFMNESLEDLDLSFSRYSINSLRHQFTANYRAEWIRNLVQTVVYRYSERSSGEAYSVVDYMASYTIMKFDLSVIANNIFNAEYSETNLVPMPRGSVLFGLKYNFF